MKKIPQEAELRRLLESESKLSAELARLEPMSAELESEEKSLIASGRFDDERALDSLVRIRGKRKMLPFKIQSIRDTIAPMRPQLPELCWPMVDELRAIQERIRTAEAENLRTVLAKWFDADSLEGVVYSIVDQTHVGRQVSELGGTPNPAQDFGIARAILHKLDVAREYEAAWRSGKLASASA